MDSNAKINLQLIAKKLLYIVGLEILIENILKKSVIVLGEGINFFIQHFLISLTENESSYSSVSIFLASCNFSNNKMDETAIVERVVQKFLSDLAELGIAVTVLLKIGVFALPFCGMRMNFPEKRRRDRVQAHF